MSAKEPVKQPEKEETLAKKQEERQRRLNHLRARLPEISPQRWVKLGEMGGLIALFVTNFYLLFPFFGRPDNINVFS
ncbi:MAG: hypothetical protein GTO45_01815, partial [Candidatus Aminicenantes bacterium]|nr:hypothetical protein [Candidatus Aminicenantes bacterium]NIN16799.1 hypothetical protein [Candidatus Aminicenantes bacterium]NIN40655.1 hypothetical protein [Candidatus Aminicenantes bacterium]NIN83478.1 hypothetical protein [Candidatus Aminicenantes bacterium]NIO79329.1 hypothetical protein [Candidatus Aminicenantes bacterium]